MEAAKAFFAQTQDVAESPALVVTDGPHSYPRAIAEVLGPEVEHIDPETIIQTRCEYVPISSTAASLPQTVLITVSGSISRLPVRPITSSRIIAASSNATLRPWASTTLSRRNGSAAWWMKCATSSGRGGGWARGVSLAERRAHFLQRVAELHSLFAPA